MSLNQLWTDFHMVRRNALKPIDGVEHRGRLTLFKMTKSLMDFNQASDRLPRWLYKLATLTARKP